MGAEDYFCTFFMHTGTKRKDVSRADGYPARGVGEKISPTRLRSPMQKKCVQRTGGMYMSQISVNHLTFYYDGSYDNIFEDVSFQIDTDWKLGFVARNGRGKTTFLHLLMNRYEYRGTIASAMEFDYFPYPVSGGADDTLSVIGEMDPGYEFWKICRELSLLHVDEDVLYRPFDTLSNGERTKVMLAVLFAGENRFLLIDEPTNHLDMEAREVVADYLKRKKGFLLVSHDRSFLDGCIDHILTINKTNIEVQQGNFSSWWENKRRQDEYERAENERLKKDIRKLEAASKQARKWADYVESTKIGRKSGIHEKNISTRAYIGEKSRRMQMRRKNLERRQNRALEEKSSLLKNIETVEDLKLFPLRHHKDVLLRMENVEIGYRTYGGRKILHGFGMEIRNGDRVVLQGRNGCGKSSILKAVLAAAGDMTEENGMTVEGRIETAAGIKISYVPQDTSHLRGSLEEYASLYGIEETLFKALLRKLDFSRTQFDKKMEEYSGGQKKKVLIARSLCEQAHLYLWDEPLNFIDIFSRMQVEALLLEYRPTLLMVEHDRKFVEMVGTEIISLGEQ